MRMLKAYWCEMFHHSYRTLVSTIWGDEVRCQECGREWWL